MIEKKKFFVYKKASFQLPIAPDTLQTLLSRALQAFPKAKDRHENPEADGVGFRLINYTGNRGRQGANGALLGCELFSYNKGADQGAIKFNEDGTQLDVDSCPPGKDQEFLEGTVYFGVLDNHVVVMQSAALRCADLERHLNWLLRAKSKVLDDANMLEMADNEPPVEGDYKDVKGLKLASPIEYKSSDDTEWLQSMERAKRKKAAKKGEAKPPIQEQVTTIRPVGRAWDAFKAFVGDQLSLPERLSAEDLLRTGKMSVTLMLNWRGSSQNDAADFVSDIAHRLRNVDDDNLDYAVQTKSGDISKAEFKPKKPHQVQWGKVRPEFDDLFPKMLAWLEELAEGKKISL